MVTRVKHPLLYGAIVATTVMISSLLVTVFFYVLLKLPKTPSIQLVTLALVTILPLIGLYLFRSQIDLKGYFNISGIKRLDIVRGSLVLFIAMLAMALCFVIAMALVPDSARRGLQSPIGLFKYGADAANLIFVLLHVALLEELAFRGLIMTGLRQRMGIVPAVIATNILFALSHVFADSFHWQPMIFQFAIGVILSAVVEHFRSLLPGILLHGLLDSAINGF